MTTKRPQSSHDRCGHPTKDVRPEPAEGLFSNSLEFPRCTFTFADGRRCALPAHPQGDGLCYPHAHAPHRRLRPSDLTRELITLRGSVVPAHKIRRVLAKLPVAVADGLFSPAEVGLLTHICNLMLGCARQSRGRYFHKPIADDLQLIATLLNKDPDQDHDELSVLPANS